MSLPSSPNRMPPVFQRHHVRWLLLLGLIVAVIFGSAQSKAEFEIPLIDTTAATTTDFHGIWGYYRNSLVAGGNTSSPDNNVVSINLVGYEGWAVGKNLQPGNPADPYKSVILRFDGQKWSNIIPEIFKPAGAAVPDELNAVAGQYDPANGYAEVWMGGKTDSSLPVNNTTNTQLLVESNLPPGNYLLPHPSFENQIRRSRVGSGICSVAAYCFGGSADGTVCPVSGICPGGTCKNYTGSACILGDFTQCGGHGTCNNVSGSNGAPITNTIYAIGAATNFHNTVLAGGQGGLFLKKNNYFAYSTSGLDEWLPVGNNIIPTSQHITGIAFAENSVAYITTTQHTGTNTDLDRSCPAGSIGRLYRFDRSGTITKIADTALAGKPNVCFFGVTPMTVDSSTNHGPLNTFTWIAGSNGVYEVDDGMTPGLYTIGGPWSITANHSIRSVTSTRVLGGAGANLLQNGDFESWNTANPLSAVDPSAIDPTTWYVSVEGINGRNNRFATCGTNTKDAMVDSLVRPGSAGSLSLKVDPQVYYKDTSTCTTSPRGDWTVSAYKTINLSNIEGRKFKVSGWMKVHFTHPASPAAKFAQGGVSTTCPGGVIRALPARTTVDCSFDNRSAIRTVNQGDTTGSGGWQPFEFTVSRDNNQFNTPLIGFNASNPRIADTGALLEVHCESSYGAQTWCDDIRVEPIDQPAAPYQNTVDVVAVDAQGNIFDNPNASSNVFYSEGTSTTGTQLNAVSAAGGQHIFVGGQNNILATRIPGNVSGYIWNGTAPSGGAANGWISASCVDIRDASNRSLCQITPDSYGLEFNGASFSGRAWFGKQIGTASDKESRNLGRCIGAARGPTSGGTCNLATNTCTAGFVGRSCTFNEECTLLPINPYAYSNGSCIQTFCSVEVSPGVKKACAENADCTGLGTCLGECSRLDIVTETYQACSPDTETRDCKKSCNTATRTCLADPTKSCVRDSDCLGRCEFDGGVFCNSDPDCRGDIDPTKCNLSTHTCVTDPSRTCNDDSACGSIFDSSKGIINSFQSYKAQCGPTNASPLSCSGLGWLSFNQLDTGAPPATTSNNTCPAGLDACYDNSIGNVSVFKGTGRFLTLASNPSTGDPNASANAGWISLRGPDLAPAQFGTKFFGCSNCTGATSGSSFQCGFCQDNLNHSCLQGTNCSYFCQGTNDACGTDNDCLKSLHPGYTSDLSCEPKGFCSNDTASPCGADTDCGSTGHCVLGAFCNSVSSCAQYGVNLDTKSRRFTGYAWSPEFGWLDFSYLQHGNVPFLLTRLGDIYASGSVGSTLTNKAPGNLCNATYIITSGRTITNFCSAYSSQGNPLALQPNAPAIPLGSNQNAYNTVVGRFDLEGMTRVISGGKNKYGHTVQTITPSGSDISPSLPNNSNLAGKVYQVGTAASPGSYTIDQSLTFTNAPGGSGLTQGGAGVVIVYGDLRINQNMSYVATPAVNDLRQLASLVVIVKGNLLIDPAVTQVVGTYYVEGRTCTANTTSPAVCNFSTAPNQYPLTLRGMLIAKDITFARTFAGTVENPLPSELIIFDGRFQSNPMPGMTDFANALPTTVGQNP